MVSDGVVILEEGGTPTGAVVMDGIGCQNYDPGKGSCHQDNLPRQHVNGGLNSNVIFYGSYWV